MEPKRHFNLPSAKFSLRDFAGPRSFNIALIVSVSLHCAVFFPAVFPLERQPSPQRLDTLSVDYFVIEENPIEPAEPNTPPTLEIQKERIPQQPPPAFEPEKKRPEPKEPNRQRKEKEARWPEIDAVRASITETARKAAEKKHFNEYYGMVRKKIRSQLKKNYTDFSEKGEVYIVFTVSHNGSLQHYRIDRAKSTIDKLLLEVAELSLIESAPFPKFPNELPRKQITFNVVVSFTQ